MDVSAKQLADGDGKIVDYKAASELAKDFDAVYKPDSSTGDLPECGSLVTAEDRYEIPGVVAKWMEKGHNSLISDAVSDANLKSKYTDKKIAVLKAVSLAVEQAGVQNSPWQKMYRTCMRMGIPIILQQPITYIKSHIYRKLIRGKALRRS